MRNKILELIYKRLEKPTHFTTFNQWSPFTSEWAGIMLNIEYKLMDFRLDFSDGQPSIFVRTRRTDTPWFMYRLGFGNKFMTTVTCGPLIFVLSPLEQDALEAAVKQNHERHLQLKFDHEYKEMEKKVNARLDNYE
jgi:hypothetical protein